VKLPSSAMARITRSPAASIMRQGYNGKLSLGQVFAASVIWEGSQADAGRQKVVTDAGHLALAVWPWLLTVVA
jgi:hypothetical protein